MNFIYDLPFFRSTQNHFVILLWAAGRSRPLEPCSVVCHSSLV